jgi:hypothetical protein
MALAGFAIIVTVMVWGNDAKSSNLAQLTALCSANPNCSQSAEDGDGRVVFRVRTDGAPLQLSCGSDGTCQRIGQTTQPTSIVTAMQLIMVK